MEKSVVTAVLSDFPYFTRCFQHSQKAFCRTASCSLPFLFLIDFIFFFIPGLCLHANKFLITKEKHKTCFVLKPNGLVKLTRFFSVWLEEEVGSRKVKRLISELVSNLAKVCTPIFQIWSFSPTNLLT
jgi:hypothetical protein